jgi:hypothetical protein
MVLNLALLALAGSIVWILRAEWLAAQSRERAVLEKRVAPKPVFSPPPSAPVKPASPAEYVEVADKMLFAKDRNPNVVIETPPPKPEPPMPALPNYHGQMSIGEPVIFLSAAGAAQHGFHAGDTVGDFKLVSFDTESVEFEWHGKSVRRKLDEIKAKETPQTTAQQRPAAPVPPPAGAAAASTPAPLKTVTAIGANNAAPAGAFSAAASNTAAKSLSSASSSSSSDKNASDDPMFGPVQSDGTRACVASDASPAGTTHSGYTKVQTMTLFGQICHWEQSQ